MFNNIYNLERQMERETSPWLAAAAHQRLVRTARAVQAPHVRTLFHAGRLTIAWKAR
jgi:hypothetical protein